MWRGTDRHTGLPIEGDAVVLQALSHALSTPRGSFPVARAYGVDLDAILDKPATPATLLDALVATGEALGRLRHILTGVPLVAFRGLGIDEAGPDGRISLRIAVRTADGDDLTVSP